MTCGIYKITNKINGHSYIGFSKNIERRFSDHRSKALHPHKQDDIDKVLYKAIRKYGIENFSFDIIEQCQEQELPDRERYWIAYYNTYNDREQYNETPGGDLPGEKTKHVGEEHGMAKLKQSDVEYCRKCYAAGFKSRDIWEKNYSDVMPFYSFQKMWHGVTWKHVMPEVFEYNPRPRVKYSKEDCDRIVSEWKKSGLGIAKFSKTDKCPVGYGTLWKMINNPHSFDEQEPGYRLSQNVEKRGSRATIGT